MPPNQPSDKKVIYASFKSYKLDKDNLNTQSQANNKENKNTRRLLLLNSIQDNRHCKVEYLTQTLQLAYKNFDFFDIYIEDLAHTENLRLKHEYSSLNEDELNIKARELGDQWWFSVEPAFITLLNMDQGSPAIKDLFGYTANDRITHFNREAEHRKINCRIIRHTENIELLTQLQTEPDLIQAIINTANKLKHTAAKAYIQKEFASIFNLMINEANSARSYTAVAYPGVMPEIFATGSKRFLPLSDITWYYINFDEKTNIEIKNIEDKFSCLNKVLFTKDDTIHKNKGATENSPLYLLIAKKLADHLLSYTKEDKHSTITNTLNYIIKGVICAFAEYSEAAVMLSSMRQVITESSNYTQNNANAITNNKFHSLNKHFGTLNNPKPTNLLAQYISEFSEDKAPGFINKTSKKFGRFFVNTEKTSNSLSTDELKKVLSQYFVISYEVTKYLLDKIIFASGEDNIEKTDALTMAAIHITQGLINSFRDYQEFQDNIKDFDVIVQEACVYITALHHEKNTLPIPNNRPTKSTSGELKPTEYSNSKPLQPPINSIFNRHLSLRVSVSFEYTPDTNDTSPTLSPSSPPIIIKQ